MPKVTRNIEFETIQGHFIPINIQNIAYIRDAKDKSHTAIVLYDGTPCTLKSSANEILARFEDA